MFLLRELIPKYKYVRFEFCFNEGDCSANVSEILKGNGLLN